MVDTFKNNLNLSGTDLLDGAILDTDLTLKVLATPSDVVGSAGLSATPPYNILVESELLRVTGVVAGTKTLTVTRGYRGTTAAGHGNGVGVDQVLTDDALLGLHDFTNPMTTVGDLIVGSTVTGGVAAPDRIAAGTSGYALVSNGPGAAPTYQAVGAGAGGALSLIGKVLVGTDVTAPAASVTLSSIPGTFKHLRLEWQARGDAAANDVSLYIRLNADAGGNYYWTQVASNGGGPNVSTGVTWTNLQLGTFTAASTTAGRAGSGVIDLPNYAAAVFPMKTLIAQFAEQGGVTMAPWTGVVSGYWLAAAAAAVTSISLTPSSGNFIAGTLFSLYGIS